MKTDTNDMPAADENAQKPGAQPRKRRMARKPEGDDAQAPKPAGGPIKDTPVPTVPRGPSKISAVIALLNCEQGATLAEMVEATGWLPHTTRAALTGLKKKGYVITKDKRDEMTCYHIAKAAK